MSDIDDDAESLASGQTSYLLSSSSESSEDDDDEERKDDPSVADNGGHTMNG